MICVIPKSMAVSLGPTSPEYTSLKTASIGDATNKITISPDKIDTSRNRGVPSYLPARARSAPACLAFPVLRVRSCHLGMMGVVLLLARFSWGNSMLRVGDA